MSDLVHRLRLIVAEPEAWCKTDVEYVEDAADEIERLTAERDEARRQRDEVRRRNVHLLSQLQEFEAREQ